MDYQTVLDAVENWPMDDRIRLVQDVWERLVDQGHEPELTEEMKAELDRRVEELDRDPSAGVPWEEVKARVLGRLLGNEAAGHPQPGGRQGIREGDGPIRANSEPR